MVSISRNDCWFDSGKCGGPAPPFSRSAGALSPKNYTAKSADRPPLGTSISKGRARRITIARKAFAKSATLEFNGQNLA